MNGDKKAQEAFNTMLSTKVKIGFAKVTTGSAFIGGFYLSYAGKTVAGAMFRIITNPTVISSASSAGVVAGKYGPDAINFA